MKRLWHATVTWLRRPSRSRADDLLIAVLGGVALLAVVWVGGKLLDAAGVISFENRVPVWAAAIIGGAALMFGLWLGRRVYRLTPQVQELYSEHLDDALANLRAMLEFQYPNFSLRDYVENGVFQPAQKLLMTRGRRRGEVRFSILHPSDQRPDVFRMRSDNGDLYPALGHSMEGRQNFEIEIDRSFSGYAYRTGKTQISNDVQHDDRWHQHPHARPDRRYGSLVAVPLVSEGNPDGVLNVIATENDAFDETDQTYVGLLGSIIDVVRAATVALRPGEDEDEDEDDDS